MTARQKAVGDATIAVKRAIDALDDVRATLEAEDAFGRNLHLAAVGIGDEVSEVIERTVEMAHATRRAIGRLR